MVEVPKHIKHLKLLVHIVRISMCLNDSSEKTPEFENLSDDDTVTMVGGMFDLYFH